MKKMQPNIPKYIEIYKQNVYKTWKYKINDK